MKRFGRDSFQEAIKISNRVDFSHVNWDKFRYMVYDVPTEHRPYRDRHAKLGKLSSLLLIV
mgnify:CR=1 FL=1